MHRKSTLMPSKIKGVPDWVVENLSPSNTRLDTQVKRQLHQRSGMPVCCMVDPDEHVLRQLILEEELTFKKFGTCGTGIKKAHSLLSGLLR
jgi:hypothetical protein